jgi:hypothetical protein
LAIAAGDDLLAQTSAAPRLAAGKADRADGVKLSKILNEEFTSDSFNELAFGGGYSAFFDRFPLAD